MIKTYEEPAIILIPTPLVTQVNTNETVLFDTLLTLNPKLKYKITTDSKICAELLQSGSPKSYITYRLYINYVEKDHSGFEGSQANHPLFASCSLLWCDIIKCTQYYRVTVTAQVNTDTATLDPVNGVPALSANLLINIISVEN